jgi:hypothetical protein
MKRTVAMTLVFLFGVAACGGGGSGTDGGAAPPPVQTIDTAKIDAQAVSMATQILSGPSQSAPAVQQALLATGFAIQAADGTVTLPSAAASQGMLLSQWDADAMTAGTDGGGYVTLDDLAAAIQLAFPELDASQIAANIVTDIAASAASDQPTVRLWARLIVELSRQREAPYDLLAPDVDPTQVDLDPVQLNLLLERFIGDVMASVDEAPTGFAPATTSLHAFPARVRPLTTATGPCTLTDTQEMIMDKAAMAETKGFKQLIGYLEKKGVAGAGTLSKISGRISAVLMYGKLLASLLAFNMDFKADLTELVRTLSTVNGGQQMKVTATVRFDNGNAQLLNCVRQVGNLLGFDFKLTPTGPIKNAEIIWYLLAGDTSGSQGTLGYLRWAKGSIPNVGRFTDGSGQDTITIEGAPQKKVMRNPHSVEKPGKVHAKVNLKSANIVQDLLTAIGGAASLPVEMAYRTGLGFERSYSFTVVDWDDCTESGSSAGRAGALAANVCRDTWTGTASFAMGADPASAPTTSASVVWVFSNVVGNVVHYQPTGIASFSFPNCVITPSSETMSTQPGGGTGGDLAIDFGNDPPTYQLQGSTVWAATYQCNGVQAGAGGLWVGDPATSQFVAGSLAVSQDAQSNQSKLTVSGSASGQGGSTSWNFTKD